jgi:DNA-binding transcriptional regulator YdaS (Cro superfamily)
MKQRNHTLINVFAAFGSMSQLAKHLGVTRAAVSHWKIIPLRHLAEISKITGIPRPELRPDLYEEPVPASYPSGTAQTVQDRHGHQSDR